MNAKDFMLEELALQEHVIIDIKKLLIEQNVKRLLDHYLGTYVLEEGEVLEPWTLEELDSITKRIAIAKYQHVEPEKPKEPVEPEEPVKPEEQDDNNVYLYYGYDDEPIEIVIV